MLGKLIKHEFRATGRMILPMFTAVLIVSVLARFAFRMLDSGLPIFLGLFLYFIVFAFFIGLIGAFIYTFVIMVVRFKRNILSDEGYLTMTLPASIHSVLWSKIIVSIVWSAATVLVVGLGAVIAAFDASWVYDILKDLGYLAELFLSIDNKAQVIGWFFAAIVYVIVYSITYCLNIYSCMAIGYGFARHKALLSGAAFIAIGIVMSWVSGSELQYLAVMNDQVPFSVGFYQNFAVMLGTQLFKGAVFYVITWLNLKYRLNLE